MYNIGKEVGMKMKKKYTFQIFQAVYGDLLIEYLREMAQKGWKFKKMITSLSLMVFEEAEPEDRFYQWECLNPSVKTLRDERKEEIKQRHREEGWEYAGECGEVMLFSSVEKQDFIHTEGEEGKSRYIFENIKNNRRKMLGTVVGTLFVIGMIMLGWSVKWDYSYWEDGLLGAFDILRSYLILAWIPAIMFDLFINIADIFESSVALQKRKIVEGLLEEGKTVTYGVWKNYKKDRKKCSILLLLLWSSLILGGVTVLFDLIIQDGFTGFGVFLVIFLVICLVFSLIQKRAKKAEWKRMKKVVVYLIALVILVPCLVIAILLTDLSGDSTDEKWDNYLPIEKIAKTDLTYPPELFQITDLSGAGCMYEKTGTLFGSCEYFDLYWEYDEEKDYQYYVYRVKSKTLYRFLRKQAVKNFASYTMEPVGNIPEGTVAYKVDWNKEIIEDAYYDNGLLVFKDNEIVLLNHNLNGYTPKEMVQLLVLSK